MKLKRKIIFIIVLVIIVLFLGMALINSYFGWYGYEKWKYRRDTYGDKIESIKRKTFIKELDYKSNLSLTGFDAYIEKGYWFGFHNMDDTRFKKGTKYPYQISFNGIQSVDNVFCNVVNFDKFDSINNDFFERPNIYLDKPYLKDTIILKVIKFNKERDSIGYIKIWDKDITKKQN